MLIFLSIAAFFFFLWFENLFFYFYDVYTIFPELMSNMKTYLVIMIACWFCMAQDMAKSLYKKWQEDKRRAKLSSIIDQRAKLDLTLSVDQNFEQNRVEGSQRASFEVSSTMV